MAQLLSVKRVRLFAIALLFAGVMVGCGSDYRPNIDLDKVLEITGATLQEPVPEALTQDVPRDLSAASGQIGSSRTVALQAEQTDAELNVAFLEQLAKNLNEAKLLSSPLGTRFDADGAIIGFTDSNKDMARNGGDKDVFKIQVDASQQRLVATDLEDPAVHRDHYYHGYNRWGRSYWGPYALGTMRGSQDRYHRTRGSSPNFSSMSMAPSGYAKPGSSYRSPSVRSMGGSKSFSGGK